MENHENYCHPGEDESRAFAESMAAFACCSALPAERAAAAMNRATEMGLPALVGGLGR